MTTVPLIKIDPVVDILNCEYAVNPLTMFLKLDVINCSTPCLGYEPSGVLNLIYVTEI